MAWHMSSADSNCCVVKSGACFGTCGRSAAGRLSFYTGSLTDAWQHEKSKYSRQAVFDTGPRIVARQREGSKHSRQAVFDTGPLIGAWQHEGSRYSVQPRLLTGADLQQY